MSYLVEFFDRDERTKPGTEWNCIVHLDTVRGVTNRMRKRLLTPVYADAYGFRIRKFSYADSPVLHTERRVA